ncbi:hypothetical protein B7C42_06062 [Nocardia cerradoensis]|uniref:Uncharacterized protein n=1 Tax=Nocardia cerradoensis TaxID=85688 RepID=A0A231GYQ2_9NOCA|nr:hypothetical protein B7C42_06062 [Nocardia cerradoensis]
MGVGIVGRIRRRSGARYGIEESFTARAQHAGGPRLRCRGSVRLRRRRGERRARSVCGRGDSRARPCGPRSHAPRSRCGTLVRRRPCGAVYSDPDPGSDPECGTVRVARRRRLSGAGQRPGRFGQLAHEAAGAPDHGELVTRRRGGMAGHRSGRLGRVAGVGVGGQHSASRRNSRVRDRDGDRRARRSGHPGRSSRLQPHPSGVARPGR